MPGSPGEKEVRRAARKAALAVEGFERTIVAAHPNLSLRKIAEAAGVSHEQVRQIIARRSA